MLNHIFGILDQLGFNQQKRAISIQFSNQELNHQVMLQRIDGYHAMNEGLSAELICLSTNPYIPLKQFIGCQVAVDQVTDIGQLYRTTGIITGASQGQSDGALSLYRLTLQDATSLWHKRRNSRVFMSKSAIEIIEIIFKEWQNKSPLFAASLKLDSSGLSKDYDIRPFSMQSNESDYAYLTRLMREESINWLIDEDSYLVAVQGQEIQAQKLRLMDDNSYFQALQRRSIRYHRSNATEQQDSITSFIAQRQLQPTAIYVQRWQADSLSQEDASGSVLSTHQHSQQRDNESLSLEQAWNISPAWITDLNGEDQATTSGNSQLEKLNKQLNQYQALQAKSFIARSSVRDTQVGYWFQLIDHPELEKNHSQNDKEFLILSKRFYNQNNLPKDIHNQVEQLLSLSHWQSSKDSQQERQANEMTLVRRSIDVVPEYDPLQHRATAHVQRARVVGAQGEEIYVDEWGRIKVRFLFTRNEDHQHDGGAGRNDSDTDSAWVDVLTPWAGEGYGVRFLPRIGEIVVIDFFDGNIDRPFVTGRIHEAQRSPTKFDIKGQLPDTKKLSGIRSKEVGGEGYNQLRFDDTTGQISAQLHSSHGATQLNLGNLSHPKQGATSDGRGEGFELRTDDWGAIRAAKGLFLGTDIQSNAEGKQLDIDIAIQQLEQALNQIKVLQKGATQAKADPKDGYMRYPSLKQQLDDQLKRMAKPNILISTPTGIAVTSPKSHSYNAGESITMIANQQIDLNSMGQLTANSVSGISLYAQQGGLKALANQGEVQIQAQNDALQLAALKDMSITSSQGSITIAAQNEITLGNKSGGYIKIKSDGSIEIGSPAIVEVKSQIFNTLGAATLNLPLPAFQNVLTYNEVFKVLDPAGNVISNLPYKITGSDTEIIGETVDTGHSTKVFSQAEQQVQFEPVWYELMDEDTEQE